jgi:hypothetical protein
VLASAATCTAASGKCLNYEIKWCRFRIIESYKDKLEATFFRVSFFFFTFVLQEGKIHKQTRKKINKLKEEINIIKNEPLITGWLRWFLLRTGQTFEWQVLVPYCPELHRPILFFI